jgi:hypothetical protein
MSEEMLPLWPAFRDGARFATPAGAATVACHDIGAIELPTGRIVACDPFTEVPTRAFARHVNPGSYQVFLSVIRWVKGTDERTAAAMIQFSEGTPVRWELAVAGDAGISRGRGRI